MTAAERERLGRLEDQLYQHVVEQIDFVGLYACEQLLWGLLDLRGIEDLDGAFAKSLIVDAVTRAVRDPASYAPIGPPPGITADEARAVRFDEGCPFCAVEADDDAYRADPANAAAEAEEAADLIARFEPDARAWRAQHAAVLARRGLGGSARRAVR